MPKIYGYARCSLAEERGQDINRQVRELKAAGAEEIVLEREHGDAKVKQNLEMLLETAEAGDTIITTEVSETIQYLCKPPEWCRIEASNRRFSICPERIAPQRKTPAERRSVSCCSWQTSAAWTDIQNLFKETIAEFMENGLEAELDDELGYGKYDYRSKSTDNSRNGHSSKTLRTSFGDVEVSIPRDRKGEFDPQILKKNQTSISQDIEEKILSMYAKGMTTGDIEAHIQDIYGISVSDSTVSRITDKILPIAKEWQQRPLESIYAVVFLDAIHYHVRSEGQIVKKAVYIAIGIDLDGRKDVLGDVGWGK